MKKSGSSSLSFASSSSSTKTNHDLFEPNEKVLKFLCIILDDLDMASNNNKHKMIDTSHLPKSECLVYGPIIDENTVDYHVELWNRLKAKTTRKLWLVSERITDKTMLKYNKMNEQDTDARPLTNLAIQYNFDYKNLKENTTHASETIQIVKYETIQPRIFEFFYER